MTDTNELTTPQAAPREDTTYGAPITSTQTMIEGSHHYLLCLDPDDTAASHRALAYTKARLAHTGDLVVLFSVLQHPLNFPLDDWAAPGFTSIYSSAVDKQAMKDLEDELMQSEVARLKEAAQGFAPGVRVQSHVEFTAAGPKVEKIVQAAQTYHCEIIVVGRRKRGMLARWLGSGSVSTALLTNTDYSVLVVK